MSPHRRLHGLSHPRKLVKAEHDLAVHVGDRGQVALQVVGIRHRVHWNTSNGWQHLGRDTIQGVVGVGDHGAVLAPEQHHVAVHPGLASRSRVGLENLPAQGVLAPLPGVVPGIHERSQVNTEFVFESGDTTVHGRVVGQ